MTLPPRPVEPRRTIFVALALILAAIAIYFALGTIPSALRPSLAPTTSETSPANR